MRASRSIDQRHGGLGIRLTLVRRLAELHGGSVEARSDGRGRGSEFNVRLPLLRLDSEFMAKPGVAAERTSTSPGRRVLVIDDMPDNVESMAVLLRALGHEIAIADSGAKALEIAPQFEPHVALIDIGMPDMNGYEVAKRLRGANSRSPRLVALSGYGNNQARQQARDAGFDDYLVKPASLTDLQRVIDSSAS